MAETRLGVITDIRFDLLPVALVVADFFACSANRQQSAQRLHAAEGILQFNDQLVFFKLGLFAIGDFYFYRLMGVVDLLVLISQWILIIRIFPNRQLR